MLFFQLVLRIVERITGILIFRRAIALLIDSIPLWIGAAIVSGILGISDQDWRVAGLFAPVGFGVTLAYFTLFEGRFGLTVGKYLAGVRVQRGDGGGPPGYEKAFVRSACRIIDGLFGYLVGGLVARFSPESKRIGDWAAGTVAVAVPGPLDGVLGALGSMSAGEPDAPGAPQGAASGGAWGGSSLSQFTTDLTKKAKRGGISPALGREAEIKQVVRVLGRTKKNNPVLVGEAGVGKTAIAEGLARIAAGLEGEAPPELRGKRIMELDLTAIDSGTMYVGMFEERMQAIVREASRPNVILFVDELHRLMTLGSNMHQASPGAQILKPALASGEVMMIGATTLDEWREIEKDPAMERRFEPITIPPLSVEATAEVLGRIRPKWEAGGVRIEEGVPLVAARWADKYLRGNLPDAAITLLDDAVSGVKSDGGGAVTEDDVVRVVEERTGIKVRASGADMDALRELEGRLRRRVVGQDRAAGVVAATMQRRAAIGEDRPSSLLFLGPTGVGKTELAKALASALFGDEGRMVRIDMSELGDEGGVWRLIGSPRGYKESERGGQLTEAVRREPYSIVLLDEIEKANPKVYDVLLPLLDEGHVTDGMGRKVDFRHTIVIMTSNVGAELISYGEENPDAMVEELLRRGFRPELVGRMDETVVFGPLSPDALEEIVVLLAKDPLARVKENQGVEVELDGTLVSHIAGEGADPRFGARDLRRLVRRYVEDEVTKGIMRGHLGLGSGRRRVVLRYDEERGEVAWYDPTDVVA